MHAGRRDPLNQFVCGRHRIWIWREPLTRAACILWLLVFSLRVALSALRGLGRENDPGISGAIFSLFATLDRSWPAWRSTPIMLALGIALALAALGWFRVRRRVHGASGLLCPHCHFDLSGLDPDARCPECGRQHAAADIRAYWLRQGLWHDPDAHKREPWFPNR